MQFSMILTTAALAGLSLAVPVQLEARDEVTTWTVTTVTSFTTVYPSSAPTVVPSAGARIQQQANNPEIPATTQAPPPPPASSSVVVVAAAPTTTPPAAIEATPASGYQTWTSVSPAQCADKTSIPSDYSSSPTWCGVSWIDEINVWRKAYGKSTYTWDGSLAQVAITAASKSQGNTNLFTHTDLQTSIAYGECMAGGWSTVQKDSNGSNKGVTPFGHALVQGWLAESPNDPQLQASGFTGIDQTFDPEYTYEMTGDVRDTGHHDIFLGDYTKIGCAFVSNPGDVQDGGGIYVCDFA